MEKEIKIEYIEPKVEFVNVPDFRELTGIIPTVTTFPTLAPKKYNECMAFYNGITVYKFCAYIDNSWKSVNVS